MHFAIGSLEMFLARVEFKKRIPISVKNSILKNLVFFILKRINRRYEILIPLELVLETEQGLI